MIEIILAIFQIIGAIGIGGFWIYFFLVENKNPENTEVFLAFERSFPIPDIFWATPALLLAAIGLLAGERYGVFFSIAAGSAILFLGLLDISFNAQNGGYKKSTSDTIMNLVINLYCVIFGILYMVYGFINF